MDARRLDWSALRAAFGRSRGKARLRTGRARVNTSNAQGSDPCMFAIPEQQLDAVTRLFVEEVLSEADLPLDLIDAIVDAYQLGGRIEMSEDGNRYVLRLQR